MMKVMEMTNVSSSSSSSSSSYNQSVAEHPQLRHCGRPFDSGRILLMRRNVPVVVIAIVSFVLTVAQYQQQCSAVLVDASGARDVEDDEILSRERLQQQMHVNQLYQQQRTHLERRHRHRGRHRHRRTEYQPESNQLIPQQSVFGCSISFSKSLKTIDGDSDQDEDGGVETDEGVRRHRRRANTIITTKDILENDETDIDVDNDITMNGRVFVDCKDVDERIADMKNRTTNILQNRDDVEDNGRPTMLPSTVQQQGRTPGTLAGPTLPPKSDTADASPSEPPVDIDIVLSPSEAPAQQTSAVVPSQTSGGDEGAGLISTSPQASVNQIPTTKPSSNAMDETLPSSSSSISITATPVSLPTPRPTVRPTLMIVKSNAPSDQPSQAPSISPSTETPTDTPSHYPSRRPSEQPTSTPSVTPSSEPSINPSSSAPSTKPSAESESPSDVPSIVPSDVPSSQAPSNESFLTLTARPTSSPSTFPSHQPSLNSSNNPSAGQSVSPSESPNESYHPSLAPTTEPSASSVPSASPSIVPSFEPSFQPTMEPSVDPSSQPTTKPSAVPSLPPSQSPATSNPSDVPTQLPTDVPATDFLEGRSLGPTPECGVSVDIRKQLILDQIAEVSGRDEFDNPSYPTFLATMWLTEGDPLYICPDDPYLIQRYALALLYFYTNGDSWNYCSRAGSGPCPGAKFLSEEKECLWGGVTCNGQGMVTKINLDQNNMRGSIPKELQSLEFLEELDLDSNSLVGHFPSWVGGMKHLQKLDIDRNVLSGSIPDELYGSTSLSFVDMNHNILSGTISTKIGQMTQLVFWQFDWNQLVGTVPSEVASLPNLQYFSLFGNGFSDNVGMPRQVCEMGIQLYATCGMCGQDCCTVCLPEDVVLP